MSSDRRGVVVACAFGVAAGWNLTNVGAIASTMAASYGVSLATVGLLTAALFVTHTVSQIPGGRFCDRYGAVPTGVAAMVVVCVASALAMLDPAPALGIAARVLTGCGTGLAFVSGLALVHESGGSPFAQGLFGGVGLGAGGLALAVVPQLVDAGGWRTPYWTAACCAAVALVALAALRVRSGAGAARPDAASGAPRVLRDRRLLAPMAVFAASYGLGVVLGNWVTEHLQRHAGADASTAGAIGALTLLVGMVSRPLGGWVLRRHGAQVQRVVAASLAAGAAGAMLLVSFDSLVLGAVACVLVGFASGIPFAPALSAAASIRADAPASAAAVVVTGGNVLILVGTPLVGLTFALPGDGNIGFAVVAALWLAALLASRSAAARRP